MEFINNLKTVLSKIENLGGDARTIRIDSPASEDQILSVEKEIGLSIPKELRNVIRNYSSHFEYSWFLDDSFALPDELNGIFCGDLHWGLDLLPSFLENYKGWVEDVFPNPDDSYDQIWHNKFPFMEVGNGDLLAFNEQEQIIYLSHDDGEGHGYVLANSFNDLLDNWSKLGCPGAEDWQWIPFTNEMKTPIDPDCENAIKWKSLIGIIESDYSVDEVDIEKHNELRERSKNAMKKIRLDAISSEAIELFQQKKFEEFVKLTSDVIDDLSPILQKKYKLALKKTK